MFLLGSHKVKRLGTTELDVRQKHSEKNVSFWHAFPIKNFPFKVTKRNQGKSNNQKNSLTTDKAKQNYRSPVCFYFYNRVVVAQVITEGTGSPTY